MRRKSKFRKSNRLSALNEINITPLIDLAFALLIIFMIATPLLEQTIPLDLPNELAKKQELSKKKVQIISINYAGDFFWGNKKVADEEMFSLLGELSKKKDIPILRIRADQKISYNRVVQLIDLIKQNNLTKISLDTEVK